MSSRPAVLRRDGLPVESGPLRAPSGFRVGDLPDEPLDERGLGVQQREPVLLLDQEQRGHALGKGALDDGLDLGALRGQPGEPLPEQGENLAGWQRADQRERGHEVRVLVLRLLDQLAQPVAQLGPAHVGDGVHGPLRALPLAAGFLLGDEPRPFQLLDHHVQRAVVELDAPLVTMVAQRAAQLVGVHGSLRQVGQHREREQVAHLAFVRHLLLRGSACRPGGTHCWLVVRPYWLVVRPYWLVVRPYWLVVRPYWLVVRPGLLVVRPCWLVVRPYWLVVRPYWLVVTPYWLVVRPYWLVVRPYWLVVRPYWLVVRPC